MLHENSRSRVPGVGLSIGLSLLVAAAIGLFLTTSAACTDDYPPDTSVAEGESTVAKNDKQPEGAVAIKDPPATSAPVSSVSKDPYPVEAARSEQEFSFFASYDDVKSFLNLEHGTSISPAPPANTPGVEQIEPPKVEPYTTALSQFKLVFGSGLEMDMLEEYNAEATSQSFAVEVIEETTVQLSAEPVDERLSFEPVDEQELEAGENVVTARLMAGEDTIATIEVTINVLAAPDASLEAVSVSYRDTDRTSDWLSPAFTPATYNYELKTYISLPSLAFTFTPRNEETEITQEIAGNTLTVTAVATVLDQTDTRVYTFTRNPPPPPLSSDAALGSVEIYIKDGDGIDIAETLTPLFDPSVTSYGLKPGTRIGNLDFVATPRDSRASIVFNNLHNDTTHAITVRAENGVERTYYFSESTPPDQIDPVPLAVPDNAISLFAANEVTLPVVEEVEEIHALEPPLTGSANPDLPSTTPPAKSEEEEIVATAPAPNPNPDPDPVPNPDAPSEEENPQ